MLFYAFASIAVIHGAMGAAPTEPIADVERLFAEPPREYSSAPFWVWNDRLTEDQLRATLRDLAGPGIRQAIVHPRPGLMTPYLSDEWFRMWDIALDEADKLGMNLWIYDENSYPSGFAGGFVPEAMPDSRGLGIEIKKGPLPVPGDKEVVAVFRADPATAGYQNVTKEALAGGSVQNGEFLVARLRQAGESPWYGGKHYVDLLRPGVTEKFLELTLEPYRARMGDRFGKSVPGVFTDEPHLRPAGGLHWTPDLAEAFQERWGYSLIDSLPSLVEETGDWKRVRHNYNQLLLDLFINRWAKPYHDYCERYGLEFTGHYWEHSWPDTQSAPDNMAMYAWHQRPAIDMLFNHPYDEGPQAQVGNVRAVMELAGVANQLGISRTLCENYGGSGWDARFEDLKRIGDWLQVLGVNTFNEHLSHITLRGSRKADYPPSFSYHNPWFAEYRVLVDYYKRLSLVLSHGEQINEVLLIEPTSTLWMYQTTGRERRDEIGNRFQQLVHKMAEAQVEFDLGSEDIITDHGSVDGDAFVVGKRRYTTVVLPPLMENLNGKTAALLDQYLDNGGVVIACDGAVPTLINGLGSPIPAEMAQMRGWTSKSVEEAVATLAANGAEGFAVRRSADDKGRLLHHRRRYADGDMLFLVNTSPDAPAAGTVVASAAAGVAEWDLETGGTKSYAFKAGNGVEAAFDLPPAGSLLLFLSTAATEPAAPALGARTALETKGDISVRRDEPNVLTLDYVDITVGGETRKDVYFYTAEDLAFRKNGMDRNPWDHAVQFKDEYISKVFPPESGFEATYRFTIGEAVPASIEAVVERPDLYTITCNDTPVSAKPGEWWLDRSFGRIDLAPVARVGENELTLKASPFTISHELQPAYVVGDFAVKPAEKGFVIAPAQPLTLGPWKEQGLSLYGHDVTYTRTVDASGPATRYVVSLPAWYGSVAKVRVNGQDAGHIYRRPWECDVTAQMKPGENVVEVTVIGTLKNTLGPFHNKPGLGFAGPDSFRKGPEPGPPPGAEYDTVAYGLFEPFVVSAE